MSHAGGYPTPEKRPACGVAVVDQSGLPFENGSRTKEIDVAHASASTLFDNLELAVIALGKRDPVTRNLGTRARAIDRLFGVTTPNALAAPRLEALRLLVIALRQRDRYPDVEVVAALTSGFSQDQIDWLSKAGSTSR